MIGVRRSAEETRWLELCGRFDANASGSHVVPSLIVLRNRYRYRKDIEINRRLREFIRPARLDISHFLMSGSQFLTTRELFGTVALVCRDWYAEVSGLVRCRDCVRSTRPICMLCASYRVLGLELQKDSSA